MAMFKVGDIVTIDTETLGASEDEDFMLCLVDKDLVINSVVKIDDEFSYYRCSLGEVELLFNFIDADLVIKTAYKSQVA